MAGRVAYYGNIITDSLVIDLDAAKKDSYPGYGTTWVDVSGNGNNGNLINGPTYNSSNGGYISCDGVNDYIQVNDNATLDFGSNNFTVEYWFRRTSAASGYNNVWGVNKWNTGGATLGQNEWSLSLGDANVNNYAFYVEVGTTIYGTGLSSTPLTINVWYQLVGIRNGGSLQTYLNGSLSQNVSPVGFTSSSVINNVGRNVKINTNQTNGWYTKADNAILRIYNRALASTEVLQNYNATKGRYGL